MLDNRQMRKTADHDGLLLPNTPKAEEKPSGLASLLAGLGAQVGAEGTNKAYASLLPRITKAGPREQRLFAKLMEKAKDMGVTVNKLDAKNIASYTHENKTIALGRNLINPGVLAHEMGHALEDPRMLKLNTLGKPVVTIGSLGALLSGDEGVSRGGALLGTLGGLATLSSEINASSKGYKLLRGAGSSKLRSLKALAGLPTYAVGTAIPGATYLARKLTGAFDEPAEG